MVRTPLRQRPAVCQCMTFSGLAVPRTTAALMQRSRAVEWLTRGPCARRRLGLHPLPPRVLLRLHRSCLMSPGPTDAWRYQPTSVVAARNKGEGLGPWVKPSIVCLTHVAAFGNHFLKCVVVSVSVWSSRLPAIPVSQLSKHAGLGRSLTAFIDDFNAAIVLLLVRTSNRRRCWHRAHSGNGWGMVGSASMGGLGGYCPCRSSDCWRVRALRRWKLSDRNRFVTGRSDEECALGACSRAR